MTKRVPSPFSSSSILPHITEWGFLLLALMGVSSLLIIDPDVPFAKMMMAIGLYMVTVNYSIPLKIGYVGLTPVIALATLFDSDIPFGYVILTAVFGMLMAEIIRPLWSTYQSIKMIPFRDRIIFMLLHVFDVAIFQLTDTEAFISFLNSIPNTQSSLVATLVIVTIYFLLYFLSRMAVWLFFQESLMTYFREMGNHFSTTIFFATPLVLFISSAEIGVMAYMILAPSIIILSVVTSRAWKNVYVIERRFDQFSSLNETGTTLRSTLQLPSVLAHISEGVSRTISADSFQIVLRDSSDMPHNDLVEWVLEKNKVLEITPENIHHAERRGFQMPSPMPLIWMGIPLQSGDEAIGAIVIEKNQDGEPFSLWIQELLLSFAGQASAAIQNAKLYSETVRLYNLTDLALAQRLKQLQALLDSITEGVILINTEGRATLLNPTIAELLGHPAEVLRKQPINPHFMAKPLGFHTAEFTTLLTQLEQSEHPPSRESVYEYEHQQKRMIIARTESPVYSKEGGLIGWLIVLRDITEERERVEWRADLTRMIVHDLRNPITTVSSSVDLFETTLPENTDEAIADYIDIAKHGCDTMLEMVDALMDINRAEAGKFMIDADEMRFSTMVDDVVQKLQPLAVRRNITVRHQMDENLPAIWADEPIVRRILLNFLDNAIKFTPSEGVVEILVKASEIHNGVCCQILDTGPGIPPELQERIFDRFVTFNRGGAQVRGTGLGLTFCKLAIEAHEGTVCVKDNPEGGTIFQFSLPGIPDFDALFA